MLNNRQDAESYRLKGVNLFDDPIDVEFGQFVQLSNWIMGGLYSIRKKRGVSLVPGGAIMPISPCTGPVPPEPIYCGLDQLFVCGESLVCELNQILVLCGSDAVMVCGQQLTCGTNPGPSVMTCDGDPLEALAGNEITCA